MQLRLVILFFGNPISFIKLVSFVLDVSRCSESGAATALRTPYANRRLSQEIGSRSRASAHFPRQERHHGSHLRKPRHHYSRQHRLRKNHSGHNRIIDTAISSSEVCYGQDLRRFIITQVYATIGFIFNG